MEAPTVLKCPECGHTVTKRVGFRYLENDVSIQRLQCKNCKYKFSDPIGLKIIHDNKANSRIGANLGATNMASTQKTKICVRNEKLPQETRGLLVKFIAYLEREGYYEKTSYYALISSLANNGANLLDPEDVKTKIARHKYKNKAGEEKAWKESTKSLAVLAYDSFCRMEGIAWSKPKYKREETILIVPDEKDLDALINSGRSKRMVAFLQCLKETYCDPGEILALEWKEIKDNIITIAHPCKGHYAGQYEVSNRLMSLLNRLPKIDKRVFATTYVSMQRCLDNLNKELLNSNKTRPF